MHLTNSPTKTTNSGVPTIGCRVSYGVPMVVVGFPMVVLCLLQGFLCFANAFCKVSYYMYINMYHISQLKLIGVGAWFGDGFET